MAFDTTELLHPRVDTKSRVCVRQCFYSVPVRFAGRRIDVRLGAERVEALDGSAIVARHARAVAKGSDILVLDHYLEVFKLKPGAFPGATALARARASGAFTATHDEFWATARRRLGDAAGTRVLVEVLLAHRTIPRDALIAGLRAALDIGSIDPEVVVIEARKVSERTVVPIVPIGALSRYDRPKPTLDGYDILLEASRDTHEPPKPPLAPPPASCTSRRWGAEAVRLGEVAQRSQGSYLVFPGRGPARPKSTNGPSAVANAGSTRPASLG